MIDETAAASGRKPIEEAPHLGAAAIQGRRTLEDKPMLRQT
jgi:hypothetical protein